MGSRPYMKNLISFKVLNFNYILIFIIFIRTPFLITFTRIKRIQQNWFNLFPVMIFSQIIIDFLSTPILKIIMFFRPFSFAERVNMPILSIFIYVTSSIRHINQIIFILNSFSISIQIFLFIGCNIIPLSKRDKK